MATRPARRVSLTHTIGAVVVITVGVGVVGLLAARDRKAAVATARQWDIKGPPCPVLTAEAFRTKHYTAPKTFPYGDAILGRLAGDASCSDVKDHGGAGFGTDKVCQFTSPATLTVVSKAGAWFFVPGVGQPSTLILHKDVPRCVMASTFTLQSE